MEIKPILKKENKKKKERKTNKNKKRSDVKRLNHIQ